MAREDSPPDGVLGADPAALRDLASRMKQAAGQMRSISRALSHQLGDAAWAGADAESMRQDWSTKHSRTLAAAERALQGAATTLIRQAEQQEQASSADGGGLSIGAFLERVDGITTWARWVSAPDALRNINEMRGRTWQTWNRVSDTLTDDAFTRLLQHDWAQQLGDFGQKAGRFFTGFSIADHLYSGQKAWREGGETAGWAVGNETAGAAADLLKASKVGYPYGVATAAVTAASEQIKEVFDADGFTREGWHTFTTGVGDPWVVKESLKDTAMFVPELLGDVFL